MVRHADQKKTGSTPAPLSHHHQPCIILLQPFFVATPASRHLTIPRWQGPRCVGEPLPVPWVEHGQANRTDILPCQHLQAALADPELFAKHHHQQMVWVKGQIPFLSKCQQVAKIASQHDLSQMAPASLKKKRFMQPVMARHSILQAKRACIG